jgi:hypothetical protein
VDLLVVVTEDVVRLRGGIDACQLHAHDATADVNTLFRVSGISCGLRLVDTVVTTQYTERFGRTAFDDMLADLKDDAVRALIQGAPKKVSAHRDAVRADLVSLFVKSREKSGLAYIMLKREKEFEQLAFSVVNDYKADKLGYHSLAHEIGHLFGCCHDRDHYKGPAMVGYARAHWWKAGGGEVRTVMCELHNRIPRFSSPAVKYRGDPTGVPVGKAEESDNAKVITDSAPLVGAFR